MAQQFSRLDAAMACNDRVIIANQHRIYKTKSLDAGSDLLYLVLRMCAPRGTKNCFGDRTVDNLTVRARGPANCWCATRVKFARCFSLLFL